MNIQHTRKSNKTTYIRRVAVQRRAVLISKCAAFFTIEINQISIDTPMV